MAGEIQITPALSDALTILGAAGIVIPTFARFRINPVIGFILVGILAGPFGLGALTGRYPWLDWVSITDPEGIEPFAELGIVLLLFSIGLELSFRRLVAMRKMVFGIGAAEMLLTAALIGGALADRSAWPPVERAVAGAGAGDVLDRAGPADLRHAKPGRPRRAGHAAVRGPGAGPDALPARRGRRRGGERPWPDRDRGRRW